MVITQSLVDMFLHAISSP